MFTDMEQWRDIRRRVLVEQESKRSIQREYGIHFHTLQKILAHEEPPGYRQAKQRPRPKLDPFLPVIESILKADGDAPKKQRHTAQRIYERLRDEYGFEGGYTIVREAVRRMRQQGAEVFVPLAHAPGTAQVDFGYAKAYIAGELRDAVLFVMTLPHSDAIYMAAFPRECTETFQQGHVGAFDYFGGVPTRISYDNLKIAVIAVGSGTERTLTREFLRLQSHFLFAEHFCRVRRPNEKGHVETLVCYGRRRFLVPIPHFDDWGAFNAYLQDCCRTDLERTRRDKAGTKAERLTADRAAMLPLPKRPFEARRIEKTRANSLSLVRFDRNDYSVPTEYAHRPVTAIGGIDVVKLVVEDYLVATHRRSWDRGGSFFEPTHYLGLLERKPGAFDTARPIQEWDLPVAFEILRRRLESEWGSSGTREYIRVLRHLERYNLATLARAVERALEIGALESEAIRLLVETATETPVAAFCLDGRPHLQKVRVADVDLQAYATLSAPTLAVSR